MRTQPEIERALKMLHISVQSCALRNDHEHGVIAMSNVDLLEWILDIQGNKFQNFVSSMSHPLDILEHAISQPPTSGTQPPSVIGKQHAN